MTARLPPFAKDLFAALSVFIVAVPLCLGIAQASGAPAMAGLVSGAVGGLVVGLISRSPLSVSGPAAGLTAVVLSSASSLGGFEGVVAATLLAGFFQVFLGWLRAGDVAKFFPSSVTQGIMAAIGILLVLKQIPHLVGYDIELFGVEEFTETGTDINPNYSEDKEPEKNTFTLLGHSFRHGHRGAALIGGVSILFLLAWNRISAALSGRLKFWALLPSPLLLVIVLGALLNILLSNLAPTWALSAAHLVQLPSENSFQSLWRDHSVTFMSLWQNPKLYWCALSITFVASLETLFSLQITDRLDPRRRTSPPNRELLAQGVGNILCGLLGGLPVASVAARSTVSIAAGAQTRWATVIHGLLLTFVLLYFPATLSHVALSSLAAILIVVGMRLVWPLFLREFKGRRMSHAIPFAATALAILLTNFLVGTAIGFVVAALYILRESSLSTSLHVENFGRRRKITFGEDVTFFHKGRLLDYLSEVPDNSILEIDGSKSHFIDIDIVDAIRDFRDAAPSRGIEVIAGAIPGLDAYSKDILKSMQEDYKKLLENNKSWVAERLAQDPTFFEKSAEGQTPRFLFIGCSDSRVPVNVITKTDPGDIFVHRNIANVVSLSDMNMLSVLQYSVEVLNVRHIVVAGHYGCGGVKAATKQQSLGLIDNWITHIRMVYKQHAQELDAITDELERERRLVDLHVIQQVRNLQKTSIVQLAQKKNGFPFIHGWVYDISTGRIKDLGVELDLTKDFNKVFKYE